MFVCLLVRFVCSLFCYYDCLVVCLVVTLSGFAHGLLACAFACLSVDVVECLCVFVGVFVFFCLSIV